MQESVYINDAGLISSIWGSGANASAKAISRYEPCGYKPIISLAVTENTTRANKQTNNKKLLSLAIALQPHIC